MKKNLIILIVIVCLATVLFSVDRAQAALYYEGKKIKIVVGFAPGGGYDRMARLLAKHLPKYIPGKPTFIIENMPGASSMITANYVYNIAKPDGLTIGTFNRGLPFAQLTAKKGAKFDMRKYAWIGSSAVEATVLVIRTDLPYKTFDEMLKDKSVKMLGSTGPGDSNGHLLIMLQEFLGLNLKNISYPSSADVMLAVERKELDGRGSSYSSALPFIDRGVVRPVLRGRIAEEGIENLPVDEDLVTDPKAKTLLGMRSAPDGFGRPYVAPPGTPENVMNILREAFAKVEKDPALQKDAEKNKMKITYVSADECLKVINFILNQPEDIVNEFKKFVQF